MINELKNLYKEIHDCHKCPLMDPIKALRKIDATNLTADVFVISQTLAKGTLRESGINFYTIDGKIGNTGKQLEKFLNKFQRTINPESGNCIYNSEIAQCYPGKNKNGKGDRKPTKDEINNCIHFLLQEIDLIQPKVILLMGKSSRDGFWRYILKRKCTSFSDHVGTVDYYNEIPVIPVFHASGANPRFSDMLKDEKLIETIKKLLNEL
jgi:uracil-DNA glycosylase family 4